MDVSDNSLSAWLATAALHLPDPRVTHISPRLRAALMGSKILALESIETGEVLRRAIAKNSAAWRRATVARADQRASLLLSKADFAYCNVVQRAA